MTPNRETHVGLIGDWNGDLASIAKTLTVLTRHNIHVAYHLGHLNLTNSGIKKLDRLCEINGTTLHILPDPCSPECPPEVPTQIAGNLHRLPPGHTWTLNGFVAVAPGSPDLQYADLILGHDAPNGTAPAVQRIIDAPLPTITGTPATDVDLRREHVTNLWERTGARFIAHSHFHRTATHNVTLPTGAVTQVMSLNADLTFGNVAVLDLAGPTPTARFIGLGLSLER